MFTSWEVKQLCEHCNQEQNVKVSITSKEEIDKLDKKTIESVNVLKDKEATDIYGDKGKNGVIEIASKKN